MTQDEDWRRAADAVRRAVTRLARRMRQLRSDHGVSASKLSVLGRLHRAGRPVTAAELAREERLQPQSLTRIIAELAGMELLVRQPDATDGRQVLMSITRRGRELLATDARLQTAWLQAAMMRTLTRAEREVVAVAMSLLDLVEEDGGPEPQPAASPAPGSSATE